VIPQEQKPPFINKLPIRTHLRYGTKQIEAQFVIDPNPVVETNTPSFTIKIHTHAGMEHSIAEGKMLSLIFKGERPAGLYEFYFESRIATNRYRYYK
jgi:hypothetical protein